MDQISNQKAQVQNEKRSDAQTKWVDAKIQSMSSEEKIGQLLILGFSGTTFTPQLKRILLEVKPGGLILFSRNIKSFKQLRRLNDDLQAFALKQGLPPYLIMIDQEGGSVTRVKISSPLPSALALSKTNNADFIRSYSATMAELLNRLGINMNLAPVLDVSDPSQNSFIGSRSFGKSSDSVSKLGIAFAEGQWEGGLIPTAKHFPGHGGLSADSHKVTPVKDVTREELMAVDGKPFTEYSQLPFPKAVMLGHVSYPKIDKSRFPAAFSSEIVGGLLREEINFTGIAITDDLEMAGANMVGTMEERTVQAVNAGNDMIMVAWSESRQKKAHQALLKATEKELLSISRVDQSLRRILTAKYLVQQKNAPYSGKALTRLQSRLAFLSKEVKKLSFQSALGEKLGLDLLNLSQDPIQVVSSDSKFYRTFKNALKRPSQHVFVSKNNISKVIAQINGQTPKNPFIFYVSGMGTARWISRLTPEAKMKAIVINTNQPGAINADDSYLKVVNINSPSPESGEWLAQYLNPLFRSPAADAEGVVSEL